MGALTRKWAGIGLALVVAGAPSAGAAAKEQNLQGYVDYLKGGELIVGGQRVATSPGTRYKGKHAKMSAEIALGWEVKAKGGRQADGRFLASEIEAKPNGGAMFEGEALRASTETENASLRLGYLPQDVGLGKVRLQTTGREVTRARSIVKRLLPPYKSEADFRVYVVTHDEWNAFAMANGMIVIHSSMLADFDDDEVALILGHEIAHTTYEHTRRRMKRGMWAQLGGAVLQGAALQIKNEDLRNVAQEAAQMGAQIFTNKHSRANEDESDRVGMRYAYEAGFDVTKGPGIWRKFAQRNGSGDKLTNFIYGSHSLSLDRATNLEREVAINYKDVKPGGTRTAAKPPARKRPAVEEEIVEEAAPEEAEAETVAADEEAEEADDVEWEDEEDIDKAILDEDGFVITDADLVAKSFDAPEVEVGMTVAEAKKILGPPIIAFEDVIVYSRVTLLVAGDKVKAIQHVTAGPGK